jgi:6,7-dimethyl-8-ribityllumazine synthase
MNIIEANVATPDARVAITIARFNNFINDSLLEGAIDAMKTLPLFGCLAHMNCHWRLARWQKPVNMMR